MIRIKRFLTAGIIIASLASIAYAQTSNQDILAKLSQLKQIQPNFHIKLWTNKNIYYPDDPIEFSFRSDKDCYLILIDVATEGIIRVIFPNKRHPENYIRGGKTYNIPGDYNFQLRVTGPAGIEQVKAIATTQKMDIFDMDFQDGDYFFFETKTESETAIRGLGGLAKKLKNQANWTEASLEFEIQVDTESDSRKRSLEENIGRPAPKPVPSTGTQERIETRGLRETENQPAPKPVPGTVTQERW